MKEQHDAMKGMEPVDSERHTMATTVAAYYFGNYHPGDPRNARQKGPDWTEWNLVREAKPRFPGHRQPRVPLWGHGDESDPAVMARKIDAAADYGVAYDPVNGTVYTSDEADASIRQHTVTGEYLGTFATAGRGRGRAAEAVTGRCAPSRFPATPR